jgi:membrane-associated PAP2 superfamily phosphatase
MRYALTTHADRVPRPPLWRPAVLLLWLACPGWQPRSRPSGGAGSCCCGGGLVAGVLLGLTQTLRGAHFPSHTGWTAWLCWTAALVNRQVFTWVRAPAGRRQQGSGTLPMNTDQINS